MADQSSRDARQNLVRYFAERPSAEYDEVVVQADYAARSMLSFYRFRQLGGSDRNPEDGQTRDARLKGFAESQTSGKLGTDNEPAVERKHVAKLKLGRIQKKGVHSVSDHPEVRLLQFSVIALLVLFESAANAYFFAQQSEFGLSGGLFQAAAVSLANVSVSFFIIGYWGLRHSATPVGTWTPGQWDRRNYYKLFGFLAIILGLIIVLLVNLSAAHYRNLIDLQALGMTDVEWTRLQEHPASFPRFLISEEVCANIIQSEIGRDIGSAATYAMCRPFALHSLDAMILFALGIAISALAAFEGRGADATYPGLSDAARHFEKARQDLQFALDDYYDAVPDMIDEAREVFAGRHIEDAGLRGSGYKPMDLDEEVALEAALKQKVAFAQALLATPREILSDEFALDQDIVDAITRAKRFSRPGDN